MNEPASTGRIVYRPAVDLVRQGSAVIFWLLTLFSAVTYIAFARFSIDDAFIYLRSAQHFAETGRPSFNTGDAFNITTSPAWLLIVTVLAKISPYVGLPALTKFVFIAFLVAASRVLYGVLERSSPILASLSPLPVFFALSMPTLVGMETSFTLFSGLGLIFSYARRDRWTPLWAALFYLGRPEGLALAALLAAVLLVEAVLKGHVIAAARTYAPALAIAVLLVGGWHLWYFATYGDILSETANAKLMQGHVKGVPTFLGAFPEHFKRIYHPDEPFWLNLGRAAIAAIGIVAIARKCWPLVAWPLLHFGVYVALGVAYYDWYYYVIDFAIALVIVAGLGTLVEMGASVLALTDRPWAPLAGSALAAALGIFGLPQARLGALSLVDRSFAAAYVDPRFTAYSHLAEKVREATGDRPFTLLTHEVGIFGYFLPQATVRDVTGLATPLTRPSDFWNWTKQVAAFEPDYILYPFATPATQLYRRKTGELLRYDAAFVAPPYTMLRKLDPASPESVSMQDDARRAQELMSANVAAASPLELLAVDRRIVVYAHAPSSFVVRRPAGASAVEIGFGYRPDAWRVGDPEGARFLLKDASNGAVFFERTLRPVLDPRDRSLQRAIVPVAADRLELAIEPIHQNSWAWTYVAPLKWLGAGEIEAVKGKDGASLVPSDAGKPRVDGVCPAPNDVMSRFVPGVSGGAVDTLESGPSGNVMVRGWAADLRVQMPAKRVVILQGKIVLGCGDPGAERPDVAAQHAPALARSGFAFELIGTTIEMIDRKSMTGFGELSDGSFVALSLP